MKKSRVEKPENCYECWMCDNHTDGSYCEIVGRIIKWFVDRRLKPKECPLK